MLRRFLVCLILAASCLLPLAHAEKSQLEGVVNINIAPLDELQLIPGIGPARVRNILAYRKLHAFRTVDELARIKGIGRRTVRRWRQHLAVSGPSTAQKVVRPEQPVVGPPALPAPQPQARVKSPPPPLAARPVRPAVRRGEPAHALSQRSPANACLPPP